MESDTRKEVSRDRRGMQEDKVNDMKHKSHGSTHHEVEPSHEKDEVYKKDPMSFQDDFALRDEGGCDIASTLLSGFHSIFKGLGLWQAETKDDNQDRWASREPEEWSPTVAGCVDQRTGKGGCEQITKGVTLLQHAGHDATSLLRAIFESCGGCVSIEATHGNSKQRTNGQELFIGLTEARA